MSLYKNACQVVLEEADHDGEWGPSGKDMPDVLARKWEPRVRQVRYPDALVKVFVVGCALLAAGLGGVIFSQWFNHAWFQASSAFVMTVGLVIITYSLFKGQAINDVD